MYKLQRNKRGISQIADIAYAIIIFTLFFTIIWLIGGSKLMEVHATVEGANAALICQNNLNAAMEFPTSENIKLKDLLLDEYSDDPTLTEYPRFEKELSSIFSRALDTGTWKIRLLQAVPEEEKPTQLANFSNIINNKHTQTCNFMVPLPCDLVLEKCTMEVELELSYNAN